MNVYPKPQDIIEIVGKHMLPTGLYRVINVIEVIPPFQKDNDGKDIRIDLVPINVTNLSEANRLGAYGWNGQNLLNAIVSKDRNRKHLLVERVISTRKEWGL